MSEKNTEHEWLAFTLLDPATLGSIPGVPKNFRCYRGLSILMLSWLQPLQQLISWDQWSRVTLVYTHYNMLQNSSTWRAHLVIKRSWVRTWGRDFWSSSLSLSFVPSNRSLEEVPPRGCAMQLFFQKKCLALQLEVNQDAITCSESEKLILTQFKS